MTVDFQLTLKKLNKYFVTLMLIQNQMLLAFIVDLWPVWHASNLNQERFCVFTHVHCVKCDTHIFLHFFPVNTPQLATEVANGCLFIVSIITVHLNSVHIQTDAIGLHL